MDHSWDLTWFNRTPFVIFDHDLNFTHTYQRDNRRRRTGDCANGGQDGYGLRRDKRWRILWATDVGEHNEAGKLEITWELRKYSRASLAGELDLLLWSLCACHNYSRSGLPALDFDRLMLSRRGELWPMR
jgi:hypothetical protein